jgi:hypothetical protein
MKLSKIAIIHSGYISRKRIEQQEDGSHFLLQARGVDAFRFVYGDGLNPFNPVLSRGDCILKKGDILFMARGTRNFSVILQNIPEPALAATCFFIIRVSKKDVLNDYLWWYLNQEPAEHYFHNQSGRGVHMPVVRRSVLENIDIPVPSPDVQKKIVELDVLMREEGELLNTLTQKRKEIITATCFHALKKGIK